MLHFLKKKKKEDRDPSFYYLKACIFNYFIRSGDGKRRQMFSVISHVENIYYKALQALWSLLQLLNC